jgi:ABC-2 type transport system ATP-binding protein
MAIRSLPPSDAEVVVALRGVAKSFPGDNWFKSWLTRVKRIGEPRGRQTVLHDIDLEVRRGEVFGLLGPNGAGKTTLLKMLATLLLPDRGEIFVAGVDVLADPMGAKRHIGLCTSEERSFYYRLSARENLEFFGILSGVAQRAVRERVCEVAADVDIEYALDQPFSTFSTGMRQRLAVARAMLSNPDVLIFDEPTRAVDPVHAEEIHRLMRDKLAGEFKKTIMVSTNVLEEAWSICDRVAILSGGQIVALGPPEELSARFAERSRYAISLDRYEPAFAEKLRALDGVAAVDVEEKGAEIDMIIEIELRGRNLTSLLGTLAGNGVAIKRFRQLDDEPFEVFSAATSLKTG